MTGFTAAARLSERIAAGTGLGVWLLTPSPKLVLYLSAEPVDVLVFDLQHGGMSLADAQAGIAQARQNGAPVVCRVPVGDHALAARLLDAGAAGIVAPMIGSAAEAEELAQTLSYPPRGKRSFGLIEAIAQSGLEPVDYLRRANDHTFLLAMIETRDALDQVDAIAAVTGIAGLFAGPGDLSVAQTAEQPDGPSLSYPALDADLARIAQAARKHGKQAWTVASTPERARELFAIGFQLVVLGSEISHLRAALGTALAAARAAG